MLTEFEPHLDFWLKGQKQGFAGKLPRIKLPDGSKMIALCEHPRLYVDRWYGSDLGGGQTILYILSELWRESNPLNIVGMPIARLGYSGQIVKRIDDEKMNEKMGAGKEQSEVVWNVLKSALSQVSRERPFRGPAYYLYPNELPRWVYRSQETGDFNYTVGHESIVYLGKKSNLVVFEGSYDFTLIKKNIEDKMPIL